MVAQTSDVPLLIPIDRNEMASYENFLPGAYSIGDILEQEGYKQVFLLGSDVAFDGHKEYMTQHSNYELLNYDYAIEHG